MNSCSVKQQLLSEKLAVYFEANPGRFCDVAFAVGPQKKIIKASRLILEVACPEFMKLFGEKWGQSVVKDGDENCIQLVDVSPSSFKLFLKLLITDNISVDKLKSMTTTVNVEDLLNVMELCKKYKMSLLQQNLDEVVQDRVYDQFTSFVESETFIRLSQDNLKTILSSNNLRAHEIEVLDAALKWAKFQCSKNGIENSGGNTRQILGDALFSIRFPMMTNEEFANETRAREILTKDEQLEIFRYIGLNEKDKKASIGKSSTSLLFPTEARYLSQHQKRLSTVNPLKKLSVTNYPVFYCNGYEYINRMMFLVVLIASFQVSKPIHLHSIGFLGPIDSDAYYDVTLKLTSCGNPPVSFGKVVKRVFARKNKIFRVYFKESVLVKNPNVWYQLRFCLKGPNTFSVCGAVYVDLGGSVVNADDVKFRFEWDAKNGVELRFKTC